MALNDYLLEYTKDWRNPEDFPTYETREAKVREDMQLLFNEMREAFNRFIVDLSAGLVPFSSSEAVPADDVQEAIENVQQQLADVVIGEITIPNRSLTASKLAEHTLTGAELGEGCVDAAALATDAVEAAKIKDGNVTASKLASNAVTSDKVEDGSIVTNKLASNAVTTAKIKDGDVTAVKLASNAVTTAKIKDGDVTADKLSANAVTTAKIKDGDVTAVKLASNAVTTAKIKDGDVTGDKLAADAVSTVYSNKTLAVAGWTGSAAPYRQDVSITGILATDIPIIDVMPSTDYEDAMIQVEEWGLVYRAVTMDNKIAFFAQKKPTVALPFQVRCIRK